MSAKTLSKPHDFNADKPHQLPKTSVLHEQYAGLGATFSPAWPNICTHVDLDADVFDLYTSGALLADGYGLSQLVLMGSCAPAFVEATCAGKKLAVGENSCEVILRGDGLCLGVVLVTRTGDTEYLLISEYHKMEIIYAWLNFVKDVEQDGFKPYADLTIVDQSGALTPLVLVGEHASNILQDYVEEELPSAGKLSSCLLDKHIPALVANLNLLHSSLFLILVQPNFAPTFWRSLMSFNKITPCGKDDLEPLFKKDCVWIGEFNSDEPIQIPKQRLQEYKLIRDTNDFIGARGLL